VVVVVVWAKVSKLKLAHKTSQYLKQKLREYK